MSNFLFFSTVIFFSFLLTELIFRYSLKNNILDSPNERSSHSVATPHGGGIAIVFCFLVAIGFSDLLPNNIVYAFMGASTLVAAIGFWDDRFEISAKWRLLSHFIAVAWVLFWLGGFPEYSFLGFTITAGWFEMVVVAFLFVWLLNLFNFMDGIDGIAASETIFVTVAGAYISWLNGIEYLSFISLALAASTFGFLILNWAPAKIFMGDVGSGFLGLVLGIIVYTNILEGSSIWPWLILLAVFLVDSGVTLLIRALTGDKWYEAHCSHAYQHAAGKWGHKKVTLSVTGINLGFLFPTALLSHYNPEQGFALTLLTFIPLIVVALKLKAGINDV
ncbi:MAG: glycosyltransferase family 4 protein [Woeseiaceae bacterium]